MKEYDDSVKFWNKKFDECRPKDLNGRRLKVEPMFDACLEIFSGECKRVLDFGCGTGDILFQCEEFGNLEYGLGIDRSEKGIDFSMEMANLNHCKQLDFVVGDITYVSQMEDGIFDGIIVSNILDTVPKEGAVIIFHELTRLLKSGGLMFVKLNPDYTDEELENFGFICFQDNLYEQDGVLRLRKQDFGVWQKIFKEKYKIERYLEFPYSWQPGMNRLFLLRKNNKM